MKYVGSKNRIAKYLIPIIQPCVDKSIGYLEPFVGGANLIDKIKCNNKYGSDTNKYLIALLKQVQTDTSLIPDYISEEEYIKVKDNKDNYPDWYVGLVGFGATFGAKWFGGYGRGFKKDGTPRNYYNESVRNIKKQSQNLKDIHFKCCSYEEINCNIKNFTIYCDPPYRNTLKYNNNDIFNYEKFYEWCIKMSKK